MTWTYRLAPASSILSYDILWSDPLSTLADASLLEGVDLVSVDLVYVDLPCVGLACEDLVYFILYDLHFWNLKGVHCYWYK